MKAITNTIIRVIKKIIAENVIYLFAYYALVQHHT